LEDPAQGFFSAGLVELLEAAEAISGAAEGLMGLGDVSELSCRFDQAQAVLDDLLFGRHP
jgi:hypothetical protein